MRKIICLLMTAMLCVTAFVGCGSSGGSDSGQSGPVVSESGITLAQDNGRVLDVKMGMTFDEVKAIIGEPTQRIERDDGYMAEWLFSNVKSFEKIDPGVCDEEYVTDERIFYVKGQRYMLEMYFSENGENKDKLYSYDCQFERTSNTSSWDEFVAWMKEKLPITVELKENQFSSNVEALNGGISFHSYVDDDDKKLRGSFLVQNRDYA